MHRLRRVSPDGPDMLRQWIPANGSLTLRPGWAGRVLRFGVVKDQTHVGRPGLHPPEGGTAEDRVRRAADVAVVAGEPNLFDHLSRFRFDCPERRAERTASFVDGEDVATVPDDAAELNVVEPVAPRGQVRQSPQWNA